MAIAYIDMSMSGNEQAGEVCAIVVTFNPDMDTLDRLIRATGIQVNGLVVVDNGSGRETVEWLRRQEQKKNIVLIALKENFGIAYGHNRGIEWARVHNCAYVLLLDQDSIPAPDMVSRLVNATDFLKSKGQAISAVGPKYRDPMSGHSSFFVRFGLLKFRPVHCGTQNGAEYVSADFLISSGSLISLQSLESIGGMDQSLFIDHVDTEWFLRARAKGYKAYGVCNAVMMHSLGNDTRRVWLGRWRHIPYHSPLRHYYIFRNSVLLYKRKYAPTKWIVNDLVRLLFMFVFYSIVTPPRVKHSLSMLRGLRDGFQGRVGKVQLS